MNKKGVSQDVFIEIGKAVIAALVIFALVSLAINLYKIFTGNPEQADRVSYENLGKAVERLQKEGKEGAKEPNIVIQLTENLNIFGFDKGVSKIKVYTGGPFGATYDVPRPHECNEGKACLCLCDDRCEEKIIGKIIDCKYSYGNINGFLVPKDFNGNEGEQNNNGEAPLALVGKLGFFPVWRDFGLRTLDVELGKGGIVLVTESNKEK